MAKRIFRDLCALLDRNGTLIDEVLLALEDPTVYCRDFFDRRAARHPFDSAEERAWIALLDGLIDREIAVEMDPRDGALDLADALLGAAPVRRRNVSLGALALSDLPIPTAAVLADEILAEYGLALLMFEIDSAGLPIVVVPATKVPKICAATVGLGPRVLTTADLSAHTESTAPLRRMVAG